jgi:hypothetical protein
MSICIRNVGLTCSRYDRNVMIDDDGTPILMDFGSTVKARIPIETRAQALMQQVSPKDAASHSAYSRFFLLIGSRGRAKHNGLPCPRALRCKNRRRSGRESRHLGTSTVQSKWPVRPKILPIVTGMYSVRSCILTFPIREYPNNRAGRVYSYGSSECSV